MDPLNVESPHSLPSVEEIRTETVIHFGENPHSGKKKRRAALLAVCVLALALITGFSAAIVQKRRADRQSATAAAAAAAASTTTPAVDSESKVTTDWEYKGIVQSQDASLTNARIVSRLPQVIDFLSNRITERGIFDNPSSPQYQAALWIADQDFLKVPIPTDPLDYNGGHEFVQRYIMAVFYFALDGANWRYKAYFMSDYQVCEWNMDFLEPVPGQDATDDWLFGVQCDENGAVSTIFMPANGLKGQLPAELGDLLDLDHLSLYSNMIEGNFPERMKYLTDLDFLNLESNLMSGRLPEWMANSWRQLEYLDLGDNQFTGPVPDLTGLDNLLELAVDNNQLTGSIDVFNAAKFVQTLMAHNNKFVGWFGDQSWPDLDDLVTVDVSNNNINGSVPYWVYSLNIVDLHNNYMNGTIAAVPDDSDFTLQYLSVFGNDLVGKIPQSIGDLVHLTHLDLSDNFLTGTIPEDIVNLENLEVLYLTDNEFAYQKFPDLSQSTFLQELGLGDCSLQGPIPHWIGRTLTDLVVLDLRDNGLTGTIPLNLARLADIKSLLLNYNRLTGQIPDFSFYRNLELLYVDNNRNQNAPLSGSLQNVCNAGLGSLNSMVADCHIGCSCCKECCAPGVEQCNWWEDTFRLTDTSQHDEFLFEENKIFSTEGGSV